MDMRDPGSSFDDMRSDKNALLMMLAYVEAECRRLGVEVAAQQVALAATLLAEPDPAAAAPCAAAPCLPRVGPLIPVH